MVSDGRYWMCADCGALVQGETEPPECDECGGETLTWVYTLETMYSGSVTGFADAVDAMFEVDDGQ